MPGDIDEQERNQFWEVYEKVDCNGKKKMVEIAKSVLRIQLLSGGNQMPLAGKKRSSLTAQDGE